MGISIGDSSYVCDADMIGALAVAAVFCQPFLWIGVNYDTPYYPGIDSGPVGGNSLSIRWNSEAAGEK